MEAHEALRRHEHVVEAHGHGHDSGGDRGGRLAQEAALVVAVIAAFLAVATFMGNEAMKEVVTGETKAADASARLQSNETRTEIADGDATLLRAIGENGTQSSKAITEALALEASIKEHYAPIDRALQEEIVSDHRERDQAEDQHFFFELSEVALQLGIVLAGIAILAKRRWLLGTGGGVAVLGVGLLAVGAII